jgi:uncharacterized membrane-anchored protein
MRIASPDELVTRVPLLWRTGFAIAILFGALLALVESRASILRNGVEIRLKTAPVDPRDLFRGDYVVLGYEIGVVEPGRIASGEADFKRGEAVHVRLAPGPDGFARVAGLSRARPAAGAGEAVINGHITGLNACGVGENGAVDCGASRRGLRIAYGLESYFVPQGTGRAIERTERARIEVVAAVSPSGDAAIKRLLIDGKLVYAEPPY